MRNNIWEDEYTQVSGRPRVRICDCLLNDAYLDILSRPSRRLICARGILAAIAVLVVGNAPSADAAQARNAGGFFHGAPFHMRGLPAGVPRVGTSHPGAHARRDTVSTAVTPAPFQR